MGKVKVVERGNIFSSRSFLFPLRQLQKYHIYIMVEIKLLRRLTERENILSCIKAFKKEINISSRTSIYCIIRRASVWIIAKWLRRNEPFFHHKFQPVTLSEMGKRQFAFWKMNSVCQYKFEKWWFKFAAYLLNMIFLKENSFMRVLKLVFIWNYTKIDIDHFYFLFFYNIASPV